jgi:hypothetical protein
MNPSGEKCVEAPRSSAWAERHEKNYDAVYSQYEQCRDKWMPEIISILDSSDVELDGVWSIDFILEEDKAIMIDMAIGQDSAYYKEEYL